MWNLIGIHFIVQIKIRVSSPFVNVIFFIRIFNVANNLLNNYSLIRPIERQIHLIERVVKENVLRPCVGLCINVLPLLLSSFERVFVF